MSGDERASQMEMFDFRNTPHGKYFAASVHGTVPASDLEPGAEALAKDIMDAAVPRLVLDHVGAAKAITSHRLMKEMGFEATATNQGFRKAMKEALCGMKAAVIAGPKGFYVAASVDELRAYRRSLVIRVRGLSRDIGAVDRWIRIQEGRERPASSGTAPGLTG